MTKGLDLIQRQRIEAIDGYPTGNVYIGLTFEELAELDNELKALEIIKKKNVNVGLLDLCDSVKEYNKQYRGIRALTQEEYDILKEVLL